MTVSDAIRAAAERLSSTSDTARLDAELLMAHAIGVGRSGLLIGMGGNAWSVPPEFDGFVARRAAHEPIAYILGHQEFYGREFRVTPDVLIPRGDSETVIEAALETAADATRVLDLGTGSGALLISLLLELRGARGVATDISGPALAIAKANARDHELSEARARFIQSDWRRPDWSQDLGVFDLIVCNPPYVESDADLGMNVRGFEPHGALFAGADGLDDYRILIPQFRCLLADGGVVILEIGADQGDSVSALGQASGFATELRHDLANRHRVVILR